ncbi:MAG: hypothetical protein WBG92_02235, partial [Thiohalocapsa sp.]
MTTATTAPKVHPSATFAPEGIPQAELYWQMTTDQAAAYLSVPKRNLEAMRAEGRGPLFVRFSHRNVRYRLIDLIRYQERMLRRSTCDETGPQA